VGTSARPVGLPPEVCRLKKGQRKLKLDDRQTAEARLSPFLITAVDASLT